MRFLPTFILLLFPVYLHAEPDDEKAIEALKELGTVVFQNPETKRVTEVKLNAVAKLKDADLAHLSSFSEMTDLSMEETKITGAGLKHIAELKKIEWLNLWDTKINDEGLTHLKKLNALDKPK